MLFHSIRVELLKVAFTGRQLSRRYIQVSSPTVVTF